MSSPPLPPDIAKAMELPPDPRPKILDEIAAFLADGPVYKAYKYDDDLWMKDHQGSVVLSFPQVLRLYCDEGPCKKIQNWERTSGSYFGLYQATVVTRFTQVDFRCRNCARAGVTYFLYFDLDEKGGKITKVGQWPPLSREPDPVVVAGWSKADKLLYRDALTFRNGNKGIAALPYLRRIIENHIHGVLDLIEDANRQNPTADFDPAAFTEVKTSHRFSEKLDFARDHLPAGLTPGGSPNPIGTLYELISDGLHERTEEECIEIFDRCKTAFEYVVKKLTEAKREDEIYIQAVRKLKHP
jgi:hypothetical protein